MSARGPGRNVSARQPDADRRRCRSRVVWVAHGALGKLSAVDPEFGQVSDPIEVGRAKRSGRRTALSPSVPTPSGRCYADSTLGRVDLDLVVTGRSARPPRRQGVVVAKTMSGSSTATAPTVQRFDPATFQEGPSVRRSAWVTVRPRSPPAQGRSGSRTPGPTPSPASIREARARRRPPRQIPVGDGPSRSRSARARSGSPTPATERLSRIDAAQQEVVKKIEVGNAPWGIAVGKGSVWVSVQSP